ncbi:MAG: hypothetical protein IPL08_18025 [Saprospiraceae bacterium]|nr:hypothetical protein [Saprospiraceae bacterium]
MINQDLIDISGRMTCGQDDCFAGTQVCQHCTPCIWIPDIQIIDSVSEMYLSTEPLSIGGSNGGNETGSLLPIAMRVGVCGMSGLHRALLVVVILL